MGINRLITDTGGSLDERVSRLKSIEEELKTGRGYTSGRSGVIAYTVPDTDTFDIMRVLRTDGSSVYADRFTVAPTGAMDTGKTFKIASTYTPKYQDYPVVSAFLQIFANGVELTYYPANSYWAAGDGSTWSVTILGGYLKEIMDWGTPKSQSWDTYVYYNSLVNIEIQIKMRVKSTDKGSIANTAVIY